MKKILAIIAAMVGMTSCSSNEELDAISTIEKYNPIIGSYVGTPGTLTISKDSLKFNKDSYGYSIVNDSILAINGQGTKYSFKDDTLKIYIDSEYYWEFYKEQ